MTSRSLSKVIPSLAFIKVNWDQERTDYIRSFIPFFASLCCKKKYRSILTNPDKLSEITDDFKNEFGLIISYPALISIIREAKKLGLLEKKESYQYIPTEKIHTYNIDDKIRKFNRKYEKILDSFITYATESYNKKISLNDAERILIAFLKKYDLEIIFISYGKASLPSVKVEETNMFLFNKYVEAIEKKEPELFQYLVDIAVGHSLSNIINYGEDFDKVSKPSLDGNNLYLDTPFILRLVGAEGEILKKSYSNLVDDLNKEGVNLYLFPHTYDEIDGILQSCLSLIDSPAYDPSKASSVLRYFKELGYKESDVQLFINKVGDTFDKYNIKIKEGPDPNVQIEYQIDEEELEETIIEIYDYTETEASEKEHTILKDVQSISFIYKLRAGKKPYNIKQAKNIFVTTNSRLAYASKRFEQQINGNGFYIPVTVTDVFIGTIIWIRKPEKMVEDSKRRLLARVYGALNPSDELLRKYINEIDKLKENKDLSEEDYILLRDSQVAKKMLAEETLGDSEKFTLTTPNEVLAKIKEKLERDAERKLLKEKEEHEKTRKKLEAEKNRIQEEEKNKLHKEREKHKKLRKELENEKNKIREEGRKKLLKKTKEHAETKNKLEKIDKRVNKIAKIIAGITIGLCVIILFSSIFLLNGLIQIIAGIVSLIGFLLSILGITVIPIKDKYKALIKWIIGFD